MGDVSQSQVEICGRVVVLSQIETEKGNKNQLRANLKANCTGRMKKDPEGIFVLGEQRFNITHVSFIREFNNGKKL